MVQPSQTSALQRRNCNRVQPNPSRAVDSQNDESVWIRTRIYRKMPGRQQAQHRDNHLLSLPKTLEKRRETEVRVRVS
jgi:hypothetical protein